jgi:hypothetical protein
MTGTQALMIRIVTEYLLAWAPNRFEGTLE